MITMSLHHFKNLWEIAKTDGVKGALKYDLSKTLERHPHVADVVLDLSTYFTKPTELYLAVPVYENGIKTDCGKNYNGKYHFQTFSGWVKK